MTWMITPSILRNTHVYFNHHQHLTPPTSSISASRARSNLHDLQLGDPSWALMVLKYIGSYSEPRFQQTQQTPKLWRYIIVNLIYGEVGVDLGRSLCWDLKFQCLEHGSSCEIDFNPVLVGGFNHLEKYEVNGKDYPIYYGK